MGLMSWIRGLIAPTFKLSDDDIVVFVVGPSGSGKSTFISQATKSNLIMTGKRLQRCTVKVHAIKRELTDAARTALGNARQKSIVFVDTPSLHTGEDSDGRVEKRMTKWLSKSHCKSTLIGVIYMHRIETAPHLEPIEQHLDTFARTFPPDFFHNSSRWRVHAVLSCEGTASQTTIESHKAAFQTQVHGLRPSLGGKLTWVTSSHPDLVRLPPGDDPEAAWQAVVALFSP